MLEPDDACHEFHNDLMRVLMEECKALHVHVGVTELRREDKEHRNAMGVVEDISFSVSCLREIEAVVFTRYEGLAGEKVLVIEARVAIYDDPDDDFDYDVHEIGIVAVDNKAGVRALVGRTARRIVWGIL